MPSIDYADPVLEPPLIPWESVKIEAPAPKANPAWYSNCYLYIKRIYPFLPRSAELVSNSEPTAGGVALFRYLHKGTGKVVNHYAYITAVDSQSFHIKECNFKEGVCGERDISRSDPHYLGTWFPG